MYMYSLGLFQLPVGCSSFISRKDIIYNSQPWRLGDNSARCSERAEPKQLHVKLNAERSWPRTAG